MELESDLQWTRPGPSTFVSHAGQSSVWRIYPTHFRRDTNVFSGVPAAEHYLTISEAGGVAAVAVDVNGESSVIWNPDGQTVDLGALGASNTISIRVLGAAGSSAAVMIWDGQ